MKHESRDNRIGWYLGAFALGAAAGVAVALLAAPRTGRETRERLKNAAVDLEKAVKHVPGAVRKSVANAVQAGQAAFERAREEAS